MDKTTSSDVLQAIFTKHSGPEWVRFAEVANSTGAHSRRRADAVCMAIWPSKGFAIHGFEIKVSRADFLHEMKDITKAEAVGQFCDYWWLAAPVGMVRVDELPERWGLMELQKNGLKIKKQAPQRDAPTDITRGFMASLLRKSRDADDVYIRSQIETGSEALRKSLDQQFKVKQTRAMEQSKRNKEWIETFEDKLGVPFQAFENAENMAERMKVAKSLEFGNISRLMQVCAGVVHEIGALGRVMPDGREGE